MIAKNTMINITVPVFMVVGYLISKSASIIAITIATI